MGRPELEDMGLIKVHHIIAKKVYIRHAYPTYAYLSRKSNDVFLGENSCPDLMHMLYEICI